MSWGGAWGEALKDTVSKPFTEATGIEVNHQYHVGLKLPNALIGGNKHLNNLPNYDLIWCNEVAAMGAYHNGLCEPIQPEELECLGELDPSAKPSVLSEDTLSEESHWPYVGAYQVYYVLVYDKSAFTHPPQSWNVLLENRFRNRIALYPGGNGIHPIAQIMGGGTLKDIPNNMQPCWNFLKHLTPQLASLDYSIGMEQQFRTGNLSLAFRALPNALYFIKQGCNVDWVIPDEGTSETTDVFWIPNYRPNSQKLLARQYLNFVLQPEVQSNLCNALGVIPFNSKAKMPVLLSQYDRNNQNNRDYNILSIPEPIKFKFDRNWEAKFNELCQSNSESNQKKEAIGRSERI